MFCSYQDTDIDTGSHYGVSPKARNYSFSESYDTVDKGSSKPSIFSTKNLTKFFKRTNSRRSQRGSPMSTPNGTLFGHSLNNLYDYQGQIPTPVMELLCQLYFKGPFVEGIFRKAASEKLVKEMQEKLDQGGDFSFLRNIPTSAIASLLKRFLRSLPDCLLMTHLFNEWCNIYYVNSHDDKLMMLKTLCDKLLPSHLELFKLILCVLNRVAKFSDRNHMPATNLAVCISPSILWTNNIENSTSEISRQIPTVIAFLIENFNEIFSLNEVEQYFIKSIGDQLSNDDARSNLENIYDSLKSLRLGGNEPQSQQTSQLRPTQKKPSAKKRQSFAAKADKVNNLPRRAYTLRDCDIQTKITYRTFVKESCLTKTNGTQQTLGANIDTLNNHSNDNYFSSNQVQASSSYNDNMGFLPDDDLSYTDNQLRKHEKVYRTDGSSLSHNCNEDFNNTTNYNYGEEFSNNISELNRQVRKTKLSRTTSLRVKSKSKPIEIAAPNGNLHNRTDLYVRKICTACGLSGRGSTCESCTNQNRPFKSNSQRECLNQMNGGKFVKKSEIPDYLPPSYEEATRDDLEIGSPIYSNTLRRSIRLRLRDRQEKYANENMIINPQFNEQVPALDLPPLPPRCDYYNNPPPLPPKPEYIHRWQSKV